MGRFLRQPGDHHSLSWGKAALAHGFASPRHRGFARIGNQRCTDSAETIAHASCASKSDDAGFAAACGSHERATVTIMQEVKSVPILGVVLAERIVQMHPVVNTLEVSIFSKEQAISRVTVPHRQAAQCGRAATAGDRDYRAERIRVIGAGVQRAARLS